MRWLALALILAADPQHVLPPGQENAFADMLGRGATLPDGCVWSGAAIERDFVRSEYTCGASKFTVTLRHPGARPGALELRTDKFSVDASGAPPALREDLVTRVKAQEKNVRWDAVAGPPPNAPELKRPFPTRVATWLIGSVLTATLLALTARFFAVRRRLSERVRGPISVVLTVVFAAAGFGALLYALELAGHLIIGSAHVSEPELSLFRYACVGVTLLALAPTWMKAKGARVSLLVVALMISAKWVISTQGEPLTMFGSMSTLSPGAAPYPLNSRGFRGPEFSLEKSASVARIALIGDSFVEGDGITDEDQTLAKQLQRELERRRPDARFEVLNLGIAGNNLGSHVTMVEEATKQLQPDVIVLCLTLNNDLSPIDGQVLRSSARRLSFFSFARTLFGEPVNSAVLRATLPGPLLTERELDFTRREAERLAHPTTPLVLFSFHRPEESVRARFTQPLVFPPSVEPTDFIPGDGHPTLQGAGRFARLIADAMEPVLR